MRVLVVHERRQTRVFQVNDQDTAFEVLKKLFAERDGRGLYQEMVEMESAIYEKASKGDFKSLMMLFELRRYNIDEKVEWIETEN